MVARRVTCGVCCMLQSCEVSEKRREEKTKTRRGRPLIEYLDRLTETSWAHHHRQEKRRLLF